MKGQLLTDIISFSILNSPTILSSADKTMKIFPKAIAAVSVAACLFPFVSCTDDAGNIGAGLTHGEVVIDVDSSFVAKGKSVATQEFDSKNRTLLLGHLEVPGYGDLNCSFVSQLMPSSNIDIPDSISEEQISGMRLKFMIANGAFTGDSTAPQKVEVYRLTRQLPENINNTFDPTGYYDPTPIASRNYTATAMGMDNKVYDLSYRSINLDLPLETAREVYSQYRKDPSIFQWPDLLAKEFPGIFARNTFGNGLVVDIGNTEFSLFYQYTSKVTKVVDGVAEVVDSLFTDSTTVFTISPEVLSSNNMTLRPAPEIQSRVASGEAVIQSPGGYNVELYFPAREIVDRYRSAEFNLAVVNSLSFNLPIRQITNEYDIKPPIYLLMIKTSKMKEFFANNSVPKGYVGEETDTDAFWSAYDADTGSYTFSAMRPYIIDLMNKESISDEDCRFTIVPVEIRTELWGSSYNQKYFVSSCLPYITRPSMGIVNFDAAKIRFTFSRQKID